MLPKENRITKKKEFDGFFGRDFKVNGGYSVSSNNFVIKTKLVKSGSNRIGFIINTKVDKRATVRNRVKRQVREIFFNNLKQFNRKVDVLVVIQPAAKNLTFKQIEDDVVGMLRKIRLI
ncbi:TPA: ribonuclease P protein component [Candidatus Falkowbacteria bacterium]|nr:ribonuclease P protein component [Candidatus Falkowbacteria bacterium]